MKPAKYITSVLGATAVVTAAVLILCLPPVHAMAQDDAIVEDIPASIKGKVLLPSGQPAADAPVMLYWRKPLAQTRTDKDGSFTLELDVPRIKADVGESWIRTAIVSSTDGCGPGWEILGRIKNANSVTLNLVEDLPIQGKVLDQQGRPIVGAEITIVHLYRAANENLDGFLQASRDQPTRLWLYARDSMYYVSPEAVLQLRGVKDQRRPRAKTDTEGRFVLDGFGKERALYATVSGPGITNESFHLVTRPKIDARWKRGQPSRETLIYLESGATMPPVYAAEFHHLAAPALSLQGTLTDAETGEP
ncbi:MAG: transthyretin-like family protein, partial [Pirellulales bacterium]|nr:transthyretin-like family protein [Pirellulales bacterium]